MTSLQIIDSCWSPGSQPAQKRDTGDGLHEFRVRHTAAEAARLFGGGEDIGPPAGPTEKVLLRVFVHVHGQKIILLLGGYDKGEDPKERRQQREIQAARRLLTQFRERQRRSAR